MQENKRGIFGTHCICSWLSAVVNACITTSSAVAKRQHDASCLSVVSFNSTKHRVEASKQASVYWSSSQNGWI